SSHINTARHHRSFAGSWTGVPRTVARCQRARSRVGCAGSAHLPEERFGTMSSNRYTRRRVLTTAAGVAGGAVGLNLLPESVQAALAADRPRGGFEAIEHVVLLMQENRSFDHYFGTMPGVRGFGDPDAAELGTGRSVFYQPDAVNPDGYTLQFHLNTK